MKYYFEWIIMKIIADQIYFDLLTDVEVMIEILKSWWLLHLVEQPAESKIAYLPFSTFETYSVTNPNEGVSQVSLIV